MGEKKNNIEESTEEKETRIIKEIEEAEGRGDDAAAERLREKLASIINQETEDEKLRDEAYDEEDEYILKAIEEAKERGDTATVARLQERLAEFILPTPTAHREAGEPHSDVREAKKGETLKGALKTLENMLKGRPKEEREALIKFVIESAPEFYEEIQKKGRIEVKTLVASFVDRFFDKIDTLPETMFKELRALKKDQPEHFKILREDLQAALLTDDEGERNRKVDAIFNDIQIAGEVVGDIKNIMTVADTLRETVEGKTLTPEEKKKAEEMQKAGLAAAGGLWEKIWPIGGLFLSLMLIGLILTVILILSVSDSKFGKGK